MKSCAQNSASQLAMFKTFAFYLVIFLIGYSLLSVYENHQHKKEKLKIEAEEKALLVNNFIDDVDHYRTFQLIINSLDYFVTRQATSSSYSVSNSKNMYILSLNFYKEKLDKDLEKIHAKFSPNQYEDANKYLTRIRSKWDGKENPIYEYNSHDFRLSRLIDCFNQTYQCGDSF